VAEEGGQHQRPVVGFGAGPGGASLCRPVAGEQGEDRFGERRAGAVLDRAAGNALGELGQTLGPAHDDRRAAGHRLERRQAEGLAELADGISGRAVEHATGAAFAEAISALLAGDRPAQRRAARARAEANDWALVLPALLGHYRRLLAGRAGSASPAAERPFEATALPPAR